MRPGPCHLLLVQVSGVSFPRYLAKKVTFLLQSVGLLTCLSVGLQGLRYSCIDEFYMKRLDAVGRWDKKQLIGLWPLGAIEI